MDRALRRRGRLRGGHEGLTWAGSSSREQRHWGEWKAADWRHPYGPKSDISELDDHPVVHVAFADALAYATWGGKDLQTEADWEIAARGGLDSAEFAWGDEFPPGGKHLANTWHGEIPRQNLCADAFELASPVTLYFPRMVTVSTT